MAQQRFYDFGDPVSSFDSNEIRRYTVTPGIYSGFALGVDAFGDLTLGAGVGVQPNGIVWQEDSSVTISFAIPAVLTHYTIVAIHADQRITAGVPVEYELQNGLFATLPDGVVIGWIHHPGVVALDPTHLVPALFSGSEHLIRLSQTSAPLRLNAPFPQTYSDTAAMGANVVFQGQTPATLQYDLVFFVLHQRVEKLVGPVVPETLVQHIQFWADDHRPVGFDLYVNIPGGASLSLELHDTDLNIVPVTGSPITTTVNWETRSIEVDRLVGNFATGQPYTLRLTHSVNVGQRIDLARVTLRTYPYPM